MKPGHSLIITHSFLKTAIAMFLVFSVSITLAENTEEFHYFIGFKDKSLNYSRVSSNYRMLSDASLERRKRYNIPLDIHDEPVSNTYIDNVNGEGIRIRYTTRWMNGVVITVEDKELANRLKLKFFVKEVVYLGKNIVQNALKNPTKSSTSLLPQELKKTDTADSSIKSNYAATYEQLDAIGLLPLHTNGLKGEGVHIAILDAGFKNGNRIRALQNAFSEGRVVYQRDVAELEEDVFDDDAHGLQVWSCIAALSPHYAIGSAPNALYSLFRTEVAQYEQLIEEFNWIRAAEIADSLGADVLTSSLGYNRFDDENMNHTQEDLNGKTAYISLGAGIAATRGMFILNSAGNEGNKSWKKLNFPADANHNFIIGAVDAKGQRASFSSYGPTADGRIKPDVCAIGYQTKIINSYGGISAANGTSFSTPIMAGAISTLIQAYPYTPHDTIKLAIRAAANQSYSPDTGVGFGIPNMELAYQMLSDTKPTEGFVYTVGDSVNDTENLVLYAPNSELVSIELSKKRRILFFKWTKKIAGISVEVNPFGYAVAPIPTANIPLFKNYNLTVYLISDKSIEKLIEQDIFIKKNEI